MIIYQDDYIEVHCVDEKGPGGAHHTYSIRTQEGNPVDSSGKPCAKELQYIHLQEGGIVESGVNGVTNEALLAIVQHRLECFQSGPFPCDENAEALENVKNAIAVLEARTADRKERGVEGKSVE